MIRQVEATHAWMEILAYQTLHMPLDLQPLRLGGNIARKLHLSVSMEDFLTDILL